METQNSDEVWQKTTILVTNWQAACMDEMAADMRRRTGCAISRSALIRAIVMAVGESFPELVYCRSERQLYERLKQRLNDARRRD